MGPFSLKHQKDESSESDEENNIRHDRFRSERYQENSTPGCTVREEKHKHSDKHSSKRHRDRSPSRSHKRRKIITSSSSLRSESRRRRDRKDYDKRHYSKSVKSKRNERSVYNKKYSEVGELKKGDSLRPPNKSKLSSLLNHFDKQLESKHSNSQTRCDIGPALPPHLRQDAGDEKESGLNHSMVEDGLGLTLPPHLKNAHDSTNKGLNDDESNQDLGDTVALSPHLKNRSSEVKIEHESTITEGPVLPPHLQSKQILEEDCINEAQNTSKTSIENNSHKTSSSNSNKNGVQISSQSNLFGPALPPKTEPGVYGPVLPPKIENNSYGPALPPNFKKDAIQGPTLPPGMTSDQLEEIVQEESEDEDMVGPLPEGKMSVTQYQLNLRAMHIKKKLEEEKNGSIKDIKKREQWMLELPSEKASNLGLGPRTFRMREAPDMSNRSSWTDTPTDKLRKEELALQGEAEPISNEEMARKAFIKEKDEAIDKMTQLSREEDRPRSLLELHQKKLKKKKKKEEEEGTKKERRPFDRNIDLQVNRFDEAQKKSIFKKAQLLDTRFSTGESKYL